MDTELSSFQIFKSYTNKYIPILIKYIFIGILIGIIIGVIVYYTSNEYKDYLKSYNTCPTQQPKNTDTIPPTSTPPIPLPPVEDNGFDFSNDSSGSSGGSGGSGGNDTSGTSGTSSSGGNGTSSGTSSSGGNDSNSGTSGGSDSGGSGGSGGSGSSGSSGGSGGSGGNTENGQSVENPPLITIPKTTASWNGTIQIAKKYTIPEKNIINPLARSYITESSDTQSYSHFNYNIPDYYSMHGINYSKKYSIPKEVDCRTFCNDNNQCIGYTEDKNGCNVYYNYDDKIVVTDNNSVSNYKIDKIIKLDNILFNNNTNYIQYKNIEVNPQFIDSSYNVNNNGKLSLEECINQCDSNCDFIKYNISTKSCLYNKYTVLNKKDIEKMYIASNGVYTLFKTTNIIDKINDKSEAYNTDILSNIAFKSTRIGNYISNINRSSNSETLDNKNTTLYNCMKSCDDVIKCTHFDYILKDNICKLKSGEPLLQYNNNNNHISFVKSIPTTYITNMTNNKTYDISNYNILNYYSLHGIQNASVEYDKLENTSPNECKKLCDENKNCVGYTIYQNNCNLNYDYNNIFKADTNILYNSYHKNNADNILKYIDVNDSKSNYIKYKYLKLKDVLKQSSNISTNTLDVCIDLCNKDTNCNIIEYNNAASVNNCKLNTYNFKDNINDTSLFETTYDSDTYFKTQNKLNKSSNINDINVAHILFNSTKVGNYIANIYSSSDSEILEIKNNTSLYDCIGSCDNESKCSHFDYLMDYNICKLRQNTPIVKYNDLNTIISFVKKISEDKPYINPISSTRIYNTEAYKPLGYYPVPLLNYSTKYKIIDSMSEDNCKTLCDSNSKCLGYTIDKGDCRINYDYNNIIHTTKDNIISYYKDNEDNSYTNIPNYITYKNININKLYNIHTDNYTTPSVNSLTDCINECGDKCNFVTYNNKTLKCELDTYNAIHTNDYDKIKLYDIDNNSDTYFKTTNIINDMNNPDYDVALLANILLKSTKIGNYVANVNKSSISNNTLQSKNNISLRDCIGSCDDEELCTHFNYDLKDKICTLKYDNPDLKYTDNIYSVSFVKNQPVDIIKVIDSGIEYSTTDFISSKYYPYFFIHYMTDTDTIIDNISDNACKELCDDNQKCKGYNFNKTCNLLYNNVDTLINNRTTSNDNATYYKISDVQQNTLNNAPSKLNFVRYKNIAINDNMKSNYTTINTTDFDDCIDKCNTSDCDIAEFTYSNPNVCKHMVYNNIKISDINQSYYKNINNTHTYFKTKNIVNKLDNENIIPNSIKPFIINSTLKSTRVGNYVARNNTYSKSEILDTKDTNLYNCIGSCDNDQKCTHFDYNFSNNICTLKSGKYSLEKADILNTTFIKDPL